MKTKGNTERAAKWLNNLYKQAPTSDKAAIFLAFGEIVAEVKQATGGLFTKDNISAAMEYLGWDNRTIKQTPNGPRYVFAIYRNNISSPEESLQTAKGFLKDLSRAAIYELCKKMSSKKIIPSSIQITIIGAAADGSKVWARTGESGLNDIVHQVD